MKKLFVAAVAALTLGFAVPQTANAACAKRGSFIGADGNKYTYLAIDYGPGSPVRAKIAIYDSNGKIVAFMSTKAYSRYWEGYRFE